MRHAGSWLPNQGSNPYPLHWEHGVLTTGPPGKSLEAPFPDVTILRRGESCRALDRGIESFPEDECLGPEGDYRGRERKKEKQKA